MGSPLGVLFAQTFMASVEKTVLESHAIEKPALYCRYIDDILVDVTDETHLALLKTHLEEASGLTFTTELSVENKINFLDVSLDGSHGLFQTSVHRKTTDMGRCMNGSSDCPDRYKESVIHAYVNRAMKHCSSWTLLHIELRRVKQMLVNNCYPITLIDRCINEALKKTFESRPSDRTNGTAHKLFYQNSMSPSYRTDERVLRAIVRKHCKPVVPDDQLRLIIFYRNPTTKSLLMNNNPTRDKTMLKQCNVIYSYKCPLGDCALRQNCKYIGLTTTSLSRRITMHVQSGGPKMHTETYHEQRLTRKQMVENTTILDRCKNPRKLQVLEAIYIRDHDPTINRQVNARGTLTLYEGIALGPRRA